MTDHEILRKYYLDQVRTGRGGSVVYWKGSRMQKGSGIGTILQNVFKSPLVKKGLKYVAKTGISTAGDVLSNLIDGQSLKNASQAGLSRQVEVQKAKAMRKLKKMVNPPLPKPKRVHRRKTRRKRSDNFNLL